MGVPRRKIEPGESPEQALARELHEELGIEAAIGEKVTITVHEYEFVTIELTTFRCTTEANLTTEGLTLTDHDATHWVTPDKAQELERASADIPNLKLLALE